MKSDDDARKKVTIYTHGLCLNPTGPGGYSAILVYKKYDGHPYDRELDEGFPFTTQRRVELMSVIYPLRALKEPCKVNIVTTSQYVAWGLQNPTLDPLGLEADLWRELSTLCEQHKVEVELDKEFPVSEAGQRCIAYAYGNAMKAWDVPEELDEGDPDSIPFDFEPEAVPPSVVPVEAP